MFRIKYKIIIEQYGEIEHISDEEIQYDFLLGSISLSSSDAAIELEWEWIPLLDFAYRLKRITGNLKASDAAKEDFGFTENTETLEFTRNGGQLKISASFSPTIITTDLDIFEGAVNDFHFNISKHIMKNISNKPSRILQKYLTVDSL